MPTSAVVWLDLGKFQKYVLLLLLLEVLSALHPRYWIPYIRKGVRNMVESETSRKTFFVKMTGHCPQFSVLLLNLQPSLFPNFVLNI